MKNIINANQNLNDVLELKTPEDLWHYIHENIKYGWTNKNGEFREYNDPRMLDEYYYHSPEETVNRKSGICGDQVLLENNFENHIVTFGFKDSNGKIIGGGHTFIAYIENEKYYYFENAFSPCANIVEFENFNDLVGDVIAAYLVCTNNIDKIDRLYIIVDDNLVVNMNSQQKYEQDVKATDNSISYNNSINIGIKKFS